MLHSSEGFLFILADAVKSVVKPETGSGSVGYEGHHNSDKDG